MKKYAEVAVFLPVKRTFHYRIPKRWQGRAAVGLRVRVPFGRQHRIGMVVGLPSMKAIEGLAERTGIRRIKPIAELLDEEPVLRPDLLELTRWMAAATLAGWGEAIAAALPAPLRRGSPPAQPRAAEAEIQTAPTTPIPLNAEQRRAMDALRPFLNPPSHRVFLLHGVTASGKTELYLQAIEAIRAQGRSSIVLVPEISLTPQAIQRFQGRFGREAVAVLHSGMLESRRFQEWKRIRSGEATVVVGARSAIFAPVRDLGLVVVDEEHEPSYKQEEAPRYHAREVAIQRGRLAHAPVILGSATPSLETYYQTSPPSLSPPSPHPTLSPRGGEEKGEGVFIPPGWGEGVCLLRLKQRVEEALLPEVEIVDMREELATGPRHQIFSRALERALAQALSDRQQAILFLNRRGFSTFIHCPRCGRVLKCRSCELPYTYHLASRQMLCHHCQSTADAPETCPGCRSQYVRFRGTGTERVESELARLFPEARISRMDSDSTRVRDSHIRILERFSAHDTDVLVGTQMVAKGLDFPRVTLVGVISADTALNLPDFRSAERTFQLLTQVAGRAGRGALPGRVIIQTYAPHHYAILAAQRHDYGSFFQKEIEIRRQLSLPPFAHLVRLMVRSPRQAKASEFSGTLAQACRKLEPHLTVLGPAPAPIPRLRRQYRFQVLLKAKDPRVFEEKLPDLLDRHRPPRGCALAVDRDPL